MSADRNHPLAGLSGIAACVVFWLVVLVLGAQRPSCSHLFNDVSELGAIGTPNAILWNIFGFIVPGLGRWWHYSQSAWTG